MGTTRLPHLILERRTVFKLIYLVNLVIFLLLIQVGTSPRPSLEGSSTQMKPKKWFLVDPPFG